MARRCPRARRAGRGHRALAAEAADRSRPAGATPTQDGDHAGGIFIGGATGMFAGQPAVGPPPPPRSLIPTFPYWELLPLLPSREEWRHFLGIEPPVCDSSRHTIRSTTQKPFIARFPPSADGLKRVDTAVAGAAIPLCTPRDIAIGPDGALYVLDLHPRLYDETRDCGRSRSKRDAAPDDAPARVFAVAEDAIAMSVDSAGQVWTSSRRVGEDIRVYGPRARKEPEPVRVIDGWNAWAPSVLGIEVDSRGNSYVTAGEVVVYPPSAREGDPPVRKITGPATSLRSPVDLAIGPGDTLYVLNALGTWRCGRGAPAEVSVTVYPPGADGNVKPVRRIMLTGGRRPRMAWHTPLVRPDLRSTRAGRSRVLRNGAMDRRVRAGCAGKRGARPESLPGRGAAVACHRQGGHALRPGHPGAEGGVVPMGLSPEHARPRSRALMRAHSLVGSLYVVGYPQPTEC